tara:strand:- start:1353 stop:1634 length:282 start_codon:yes stop_codon:yes gene_type:complete
MLFQRLEIILLDQIEDRDPPFLLDIVASSSSTEMMRGSDIGPCCRSAGLRTRVFAAQRAAASFPQDCPRDFVKFLVRPLAQNRFRVNEEPWLN